MDYRLQQLLQDPANQLCADCGCKGTRWASYTLGVFLCIRCGGLHRRIGTHISRIKSITLDKWTDEQLSFMKQWGNVRANAKFNPRPEMFTIPNDSESAMEQFIRDKYERGALMSPMESKSKFRAAATFEVTPALPERSAPAANAERKEAPSSASTKQALATLQSMGFNDESACVKALESANGKVEIAVEILLTNQRNAVETVTQSTHVSNSVAINNAGLDFFQSIAETPDTSRNLVAFDTFQHKSDMNPSVKTKDAFSELSSVFGQVAEAQTQPTKAANTKDNIMALFNQSPPINNFNLAQPSGSMTNNPFAPRIVDTNNPFVTPAQTSTHFGAQTGYTNAGQPYQFQMNGFQQQQQPVFYQGRSTHGQFSQQQQQQQQQQQGFPFATGQPPNWPNNGNF